jgi:choline dehydrogenase-like flavoprotein
MIVDLERAGSDTFELSNFDVCILGGGAAGLVLAVELIKHGKRVIVVETGGRRLWERRTQALNKSEIAGLPYAGVHSGRFRALGGSTGTWAGKILELDEMDFAQRHWVPGSGWPIKKSDLAAAYARAIELEDLTGSQLDDQEIWRARQCEPPDLGDELTFAFTRRCPERRFSRLFKDTIDNASSLVVLLHTNACRLMIADDGETVTAVRCRTLAGVEVDIAADRFVLCMGGIEGPRFLLQPDHPAPWNRYGLVGRFYQDHIHCFAADMFRAKFNEDWHYGPHMLDLDGYEYLPNVKLSPAAQERYQTLNASGLAEYDGGVFPGIRTAVLVVAGPTSAITLTDLAYFVRRAPFILVDYFGTKINPRFVPPNARLKLSVYCEQSPLSDSRITLTGKRDALGLFRARVDWKVSAQEVATLRRYVQIAKRVFEARGIARIEPDPNLFQDGVALRFYDQFHHIGGTRMGSSATDGVVDQNLRLFGTRNAYVCSSSVFPTSGFANPTHTLLALAVRLAWHLKGQPTVRQAPSR